MPARRWLHRRSRRSSQHLSRFPRLALLHQAGPLHPVASDRQRLLVTWSPALALGLSDWIEQPQLRTKPTQEEQSATSVEVRQSGGLSHSWKYLYPYNTCTADYAIQTFGHDATVTKYFIAPNRFGAGLEIPKSGRCRCNQRRTVAEILRHGLSRQPAARRPHTTLNSIKNKPIGQNQDLCKI